LGIPPITLRISISAAKVAAVCRPPKDDRLFLPEDLDALLKHVAEANT